MICDVALMYRDNLKPLLSVKVHKLFTISFHEKYRRIKTNTESKDENYIVDVTSETVQMMLEKFERRESKRYKLHPTMNSSTRGKIRKSTLLVSLDSGTIIHVMDKKDKDDEHRKCILS